MKYVSGHYKYNFPLNSITCHRMKVVVVAGTLPIITVVLDPKGLLRCL
jgi:hypothetical protein